MNTYEIEVYRNAMLVNESNITTILEALTAAGIDTYNDEVEARDSSVYVDPSDVDPAVHIINGLGYETDEDNS